MYKLSNNLKLILRTDVTMNLTEKQFKRSEELKGIVGVQWGDTGH